LSAESQGALGVERVRAGVPFLGVGQAIGV